MNDEGYGILDGAIAPALNTRLFGHEVAEDFLAQSYQSGKAHHAVLIEGAEGIGKATLAFRFANHILSHPNPAQAPAHLADPDPNTIVSRQIASGASHNLLYLRRPVDERSGKVKTAITIDEVRRAGHFFGQTAGDGWRIVIIDPADDMNRNAANAILKLLEEPPKRAMFLVLSHAPGRLLPTIRSRCQTLRLTPLDPDTLERALDHLRQSIRPELRARALVLANGSVSQALKLINYGGLDIIEAFDAVTGAEGPGARKAMHRLADALSGKDSDVIFGFFADFLRDHLVESARTHAREGRFDAAERMARLSSSISERLAIAAAYNLDRKQTLIDIFGEMRVA